MRIRICDRSGLTLLHRGIEAEYGEVLAIEDHLALKLIRYGRAEAVTAPEPETTEKPRPATNAAKRTGKTITKRDFGKEA